MRLFSLVCVTLSLAAAAAGFGRVADVGFALDGFPVRGPKGGKGAPKGGK